VLDQASAGTGLWRALEAPTLDVDQPWTVCVRKPGTLAEGEVTKSCPWQGGRWTSALFGALMLIKWNLGR
jgi:hypothetical protein